MQKNDRILPIDARLSLAHGRTTSSYHQSNSNAAADCSTLHERPSSDVARTPTIYVGRRQSQTDRSTSVETTRTVPFGNTKVNTNVDSKPRRKKLGMGDDGLKRPSYQTLNSQCLRCTVRQYSPEPSPYSKARCRGSGMVLHRL